LGLSYEGIERELAIQYLPEECRAMPAQGGRNACVARYKSFEPCWGIPAGETRFACARTALRIGGLVSDEAKACEGETGTEQASCKATIREKAYAMVKFRIYDLAERAEELLERGARPETVANFVALAEQKKQEFNAAKTSDERKNIVNTVRAAWREFLDNVKGQMK
jgi:hypothetical protein